MKPTRFDCKIYSHSSVSAWDWLQDPRGNPNHRFWRPSQAAFGICCFHLRGCNQLQITMAAEPQVRRAHSTHSQTAIPTNVHGLTAPKPPIFPASTPHLYNVCPLRDKDLWITVFFFLGLPWSCFFFFFFFNVFLGEIVQLGQLSQRFTSI